MVHGLLDFRLGEELGHMNEEKKKKVRILAVIARDGVLQASTVLIHKIYKTEHS